jgi:peptide/nickel transport system permease protein
MTAAQERIAAGRGEVAGVRDRAGWRCRLSRQLSRRAGWIGLLIVLGVCLSAALAPQLAPRDPNRQNILVALQPPVWLGGAGGALGTDYVGRDILSRIMYGSRVSLLIGVSAVALGGTLGAVLGMLAGLHGRWVDSVIMRIADFQLTIPFVILAIVIIGALGSGLRNVILVLGVTSWVTYARVVRGEVLSLREREFITAAHAVGASPFLVIRRHLAPNVAASVIVIASLEVARMIISEAALSFLGLGVPPQTSSWGSMIADGRNYLASAWWIATFPGLAILVTVLGINLFGDWLRDSLDPQLRRRPLL